MGEDRRGGRIVFFDVFFAIFAGGLRYLIVMKKIFAILVVLLCAAGVSAQKPDKTVQFLAEYEAFVKEVVKMPFSEFHGDTMSDIEHREHKFMRRYRWHFKKVMSIEQLEQFNKVRGRYDRKMTQLNNRRRRAVTRGRIEGFFEHQDDGEAPADTALAPKPQKRKLLQGFKTRLEPLRQQDTIEALMRAW